MSACEVVAVAMDHRQLCRCPSFAPHPLKSRSARLYLPSRTCTSLFAVNSTVAWHFSTVTADRRHVHVDGPFDLAAMCDLRASEVGVGAENWPVPTSLDTQRTQSPFSSSLARGMVEFEVRATASAQRMDGDGHGRLTPI